MTDEAVEERRWKIKRKRLMTEPVLLSPQQEALIQELLKAHGETFDRTCSNFNQFRVSLSLSILSYKYCYIKLHIVIYVSLCMYVLYVVYMCLTGTYISPFSFFSP